MNDEVHEMIGHGLSLKVDLTVDPGIDIEHENLEPGGETDQT